MQVAKSTEYVESGKGALVEAKSHQRSARRKQVLVILGILALIAIIAVAIAVPSAIRAA